MRHIFQMYECTRFVHEKVTYVENHRDEQGNIHYPKSDKLYKAYAKQKKITESKAAHLQSSCISNGYLRRDGFDCVLVDDGKGAKLLDSFLGIPFGLIEEVLQQYSSTVAFFCGAAFIGVVVALWNSGGDIIHQFLLHISHVLKHYF